MWYVRMKAAYMGAAIVISAFSFSSCKDESNLVVDENLLAGYNLLANPSNNSILDQSIDCYLDFSDGMKNKTSFSAEYYLGLNNALLKSSSVKFYRVGGTVDPEEIPASEANFRNDKQYTDKLSKLQGALQRMVSRKNTTSIFVTDFEQITGEIVNRNPAPLNQIDDEAWGTLYFKDWLNAGNRIDVFATSCTLKDGITKGQTNWVYTLVFTPHSILKDDKAYSKSILKFLLDNNKTSIPHFTYSVNEFEVAQEGSTEELGNANDNLIVQENLTKTKEKGFEYYGFNSTDLISFNTDESFKNDRRIINKIKIISNNQAFSEIEFGIKAYDITSSLSEYFNTLNQDEPEVITNDETGEKDTVANKPTKYKYQSSPEVTDVFEFVYNTDKKQIGIKLKPDFAGVEKRTVYKVDIVPKRVTLRNFNLENEVLVHNYSKPQKTISPLKESLLLAMNDAGKTIEGKPIYTLYIQIDQ